MELAANTVRWVMGPTGTTVTFPEAVGLPSIFSSKPCGLVVSQSQRPLSFHPIFSVNLLLFMG